MRSVLQNMNYGTCYDLTSSPWFTYCVCFVLTVVKRVSDESDGDGDGNETEAIGSKSGY